MFLLPKGKALVENFPITKLQLPDALDKLKNGKLTGYATFDFPAADCVLIYEDGKLVSALLHRGRTEQKDAQALHALAELMILADSGYFNVYGFAKAINRSIRALVCGEKVVNQQDMLQIDFKALLERIKNGHMTATLRISAGQRIGMIFYREGDTIGYYHDTAQAIDTTGGEVQHIAMLPGATADLCVLEGSDEFTLDLADLVDIRSLWDSAKGNAFTPTGPAATAQPRAFSTPLPATLAANSADIETAIIALANSSLGKLGKTIAEKELVNVGGIKALKDASKLSEFLNAMDKSSKLLTSANKISEMRDAIASEAAKL